MNNFWCYCFSWFVCFCFFCSCFWTFNEIFFQDYEITFFKILKIKIHIIYSMNLNKNHFMLLPSLFVGKCSFCYSICKLYIINYSIVLHLWSSLLHAIQDGGGERTIGFCDDPGVYTLDYLDKGFVFLHSDLLFVGSQCWSKDPLIILRVNTSFDNMII